jgi:hypothetical protein
MVISFEFDTAIQLPFPVVVRLMVNTPPARSAVLGRYVAVRADAEGVKVPVPEELHVPPLAMVTEPLSATAALLAHTVTLAPALAVGAGVICTVSVVDTDMQPPLLVEVSVSVVKPASFSAALGM